jgi:hypothetical protein
MSLAELLAHVDPEFLAALSDADLELLHAAVKTEGNDELDERCSRATASFDEGPLHWLTAHTKTENPNYEAMKLPYKHPFPQKSYFLPLFQAFLDSNRLFIPKSREMMTSWCAVGYALWRAQWFHWDCIFQTASAAKVAELVDYAGQLYRNQNESLKAKHPLARREPTVTELSFAAGGRILAIPSGEDKIRLYHPTLLILDEAAFLAECEACYNTAHPVVRQLIAVSTAAPGFFANQCVGRATTPAAVMKATTPNHEKPGPRPGPCFETQLDPREEKNWLRNDWLPAEYKQQQVFVTETATGTYSSAGLVVDEKGVVKKGR